LELTIEKLVYGGDGLSRLPPDENGRGKAVFVPFVLEGERIEAILLQQKAGFARARVNNIFESSARRVEPKCPYFARCGGCHYQHSSYDHQLEIKASILKENLRRIAKVELATDLKVHPSPPWNYRNRTRLRIHTHPEFAFGYYRFGSHALLPVEECPISSPLINRAIGVIWEMGRAGRIAENIHEIELFTSAEDTRLLVGLYVAPPANDLDRDNVSSGSPRKRSIGNRSESRPENARQSATLSAYAIHGFENLRAALPEIAGIAVFPVHSDASTNDSEPAPIEVTGEPSLIYETKHGSYRVSAGSFFQTNRFLTDELIGIVTSGCAGRTALDLYAGVGLFSTVLSREFERVIAVEGSQHSSTDLAYNSGANVKTIHATVEHYLTNVAGKLRPDLVVVDPPRGGLGEKVARNVAAMVAPKLTYVSCDPATLARDLVPLLAAGYRVQEAHLIDLFPQTFHLESVIQMVR